MRKLLWKITWICQFFCSIFSFFCTEINQFMYEYTYLCSVPLFWGTGKNDIFLWARWSHSLVCLHTQFHRCLYGSGHKIFNMHTHTRAVQRILSSKKTCQNQATQWWFSWVTRANRGVFNFALLMLFFGCFGGARCLAVQPSRDRVYDFGDMHNTGWHSARRRGRATAHIQILLFN